MTAYVWGAGSSLFGKQPEQSTASLVRDAVVEALRDAQLDPAADLDAVYVGTCFGEPGIAQRTLHRLGIVGLPITVLENACASSSHAFHEACAALDSGRYRRVLVVGVEHLTSRFAGALPVEQRDHEGRAGLGLPALYGMSAARYQDRFGLTDAELAAVSVKNHAHGVHNERAQHGRAVTAEDVLGSRMIADPLTLLQCCAISDGSAAVVLGDRRRGPRDVPVLATALRSGTGWGPDSPHVWGFDVVARTAQRAYEAAGVGIGDVDVLEVHDAFTIGEIVTLEALGMAKEGDGGRLALDGHTALGGPQPVNPSGGLLSRGHPLGATGIAQVFEIVQQLRGEAGSRQVPDARIGLVETMGGGAGGVDGNACVVCLLGG